MTADDVIRLLDLKPHPEGGSFRETFRDEQGENARAHSTAIYYLLRKGEVARYHRVDSAEIWHWYLGSPLELSIVDPAPRRHVLGCDLARGERPQLIVPKGAWQSARSLGDYTLIGCTVAPGFEFSKFELAPEGWSPP